MAPIPGRAYSPEQKQAIVDRIHRAWLRCPGLRFGQFLDNVRCTKLAAANQFCAEDEEIASACERYAEQYGRKEGE